VKPLRSLASFWVAGALVASAVPAASADPGEDSLPELGLVQGRLSLELRAPVPLDQLIRQLGRQGGFDVEVRGQAGKVGPLRIVELTLPDALRRLAGGHSLILGYAGPSGTETPEIVYALLIGERRREGEPAEPIAPDLSPARSAPPQALALRDIVKLSYEGGQAAVDTLGRVLTQADDVAQRAAAVSALAAIGGERAADLVSSRGLTDPDPKVRASAVSSLWRLQGEGARARLSAVAALEKDAAVQAAVRKRLE
jgi:hypothetical protein